MFAVFSYDVKASLGREHFVQLNNVDVLELAENADLRLDGALEIGVLF